MSTNTRRLRRVRGWVGLGVLVVVAVLALAVTGAREKAGLLDPRAVDASGSRALAQVLRTQGVDVRLVRTAAEAAATPAGSTLLVADVGLLPAQASTAVRSPADLILVAPGDGALRAAAPWAHVAEPVTDERTQPLCDLALAERAGTVRAAGATYTATAPTTGATQQLCYPGPDGDGASLVIRDEGDGRRIALLGSAQPLTNEHFGDDGDAALALGLLGRHASLVWYLPSAQDVAPSDRRSLLGLLPAGVRYAAVQLLVAVLVTALWRVRRLGPVVTEPLPVVVPAAEAVTGRGRLYRRARARDRAADALRAAARERLARAVGMPAPGTAPPALVEAVARAARRAPVDVGALLYGAAPGDDASLTRLADALDGLEREARRS